MVAASSYLLGRGVTTTTSTITTLTTLDIIILSIAAPATVLATGLVACLLVRNISNKRQRGQRNGDIVANNRRMPAETNLDAWMRQVDWETATAYSKETGKVDKEKEEKEKEWKASEKEM